MLRPGGALVLLWNREDDTIPWQGSLLQIFEPLSALVPQYYQGTWKEAFDSSWSRKYLGVQDVEEHSTMFWCCCLLQLTSMLQTSPEGAALQPASADACPLVGTATVHQRALTCLSMLQV